MGCRFKWGIVEIVSCLDVCTEVQQNLDYSCVSLICSHMQRSVTEVIPGLNVGTVFNQDCDDGWISVVLDRQVQRGVAVVVRRPSAGTVFQQDCDDGWISAVLRRQVQWGSAESVLRPDTQTGHHAAGVSRFRIAPELTPFPEPRPRRVVNTGDLRGGRCGLCCAAASGQHDSRGAEQQQSEPRTKSLARSRTNRESRSRRSRHGPSGLGVWVHCAQSSWHGTQIGLTCTQCMVRTTGRSA